MTESKSLKMLLLKMRYLWGSVFVVSLGIFIARAQ